MSKLSENKSLSTTEHHSIGVAQLVPVRSCGGACFHLWLLSREHWIVVSRMPKVLNGDKEFLIQTNESSYIPAGHQHRLNNPGKIPLIMIEVQSGAYLGEDDILRFEDIYGRA